MAEARRRKKVVLMLMPVVVGGGYCLYSCVFLLRSGESRLKFAQVREDW